MASTYTDIGTELMTTGENAGNWGTKTNTNLKILEEKIAGYVAVSANSDQTLSLTDGSTGDSIRNAVIAFTGTLSANRTITVPAIEQVWIMDNQTGGAYTLTVKASGQTGVTWGASDKGTKILYANGTDVIDTGITSAGTFDLDGDELTLDADADTSITASSDDQIDFEIAGADDFTMTANAFNVLTGSHATFADSANAKFGTGNDMLMYHDGTNSYITNAQGALKLATETSGIAVTIGHTTSETTIADNLTVTGTLTGTLATAAQGSVTSLGTLTALTVDDVAVNGKVVTMTGSASDTAVLTAGTNGTLSIVTTDDAAAAANIQITADGTVDIDSAGILTLDSGAAINIEPASGSAILLDGTISVDAGVVTGATSITSTAFVGDITGDVTGNASGTAATVTTAAQTNITSLGTLTTLTVDNVNINGTTMGHTSDTDLLTFASAALTVLGTITVGVDDTGHDVKFFGASAGAYMEWDESIDTLRIVGASADATTSTGKLLLATSLTDINASDVIGKIDFQAPLEAGGTDAITVAASIQAMAQGTFSASVNATDLLFFTGHSEAATEKFRFTSQGELGVGGANYGTDGQVLTSTGAGTAPAWEAIPGASALAADDLTAGDAAVTLSTSSGNITVDATANNTDIIFKGTDATADITMLTLDGSEAGAATFNDKVIATELDISGNMDIDGTSNLDAVDIDGAVQIDAAFTSGVDGQGYDTKFFGDTASAYIMWDTSADKLLTAGGALVDIVKDKLMIGGTAVTTTAAELNKLDGAGVTTAEIDYNDIATLGTSAASKTLTADANNLSKITGAIYIEEATLSFDATQDWDVRASPVAQVTLTANVTFDAPSNPTTGQYISILCIQDGTGSRTIAWNAVFEFTGGTAPTATTTAAKGDLFTFRYHNSHWIEVGRNLNLTRA